MATKLLALKATEEHHISLKERGSVRRLLLKKSEKLFVILAVNPGENSDFFIVLYNDIKEANDNPFHKKT